MNIKLHRCFYCDYSIISIRSVMKNNITFFLLLLFFIVGCSNESTAPEDQNTLVGSVSVINVPLKNNSMTQAGFEVTGNIAGNLLDVKSKYAVDHKTGVAPHQYEIELINLGASNGKIWFGFDKDWTY
jgi:hypothetical protein